MFLGVTVGLVRRFVGGAVHPAFPEGRLVSVAVVGPGTSAHLPRHAAPRHAVRHAQRAVAAHLQN